MFELVRSSVTDGTSWDVESGIFKFVNYKPSQSASFKAIIQSSFENTKDDFINGDYQPL